MIETERLILRPWRDADRDPFAALNADPEVRRHFPGVLSREQSDGELDRLVARLAQEGTTFWAVERRADGRLVGMTGVVRTGPQLPFDGAPEIGWRFARDAWGQGYATEAATAAMVFAFDRLDAEEIVSFTTVSNLRSQAVMARIGLTRAPDRDFDHPALPEGHRLRPHVVWVARRGAWPPREA